MSFTDRFSGHAAAYAASRPSYPPESIDVLLDGMGDPSALTVVDVGAGTGISSRLIADRGPLCIALEPNAKMRDNAEPHERVRWVDGTMEASTLPDASADIVAAFQAWHWVDHPAGVAEMRRILKPHGRMAAVYNERYEDDPFTHAYGLIVQKFAIDETEEHRFAALRNFEAIDPAHTRRFEFVHTHPLDRAGLHKRAISSSYLPQAGPAFDAMHAEMDALCDTFERDGQVPQRLLTIVVLVDV